MSLVGNLEDLSLGDILQIISLSQKSGVLVLSSDLGSGRIVFRGGLVQAACLKGEPNDLRELLVRDGLIDPAGYDAMLSRAADQGIPVDDALAQDAGVSPEQISELIHKTAEHSILEMFSWPAGDFSFDVRTELEPEDPQLILSSGINAQYLAMEGLRIRDERMRDDPQGADPNALTDPNLGTEHDPIFGDDLLDVGADGAESIESAPLEVDGPDAAPVEVAEFALDFDRPEEDGTTSATDALVSKVIERSDATDDLTFDDVLEAMPLEGPGEPADSTAAAPSAPSVEPPPAQAATTPSEPAIAEASIPAEARMENAGREPDAASQAPTVDEAPATDARRMPVVVIDPDVAVLEWIKAAIEDDFARVHVFQQAEQGLSRIRQYLIRGETPLVLLSPETQIDPLSGIHGLGDFVKRLKAQSPRIVVLGLRDDEDAAPAAMPGTLNGVLRRPPRNLLLDKSQPDGRAASEVLARALLEILAQQDQPTVSGQGPGAVSLRGLRDATAKLQDASSRGEILPVVLDFASEIFARVAILIVREDEVFAIAGRGISTLEVDPLASTPPVTVPTPEAGWIRTVLDSGKSVVAAPSGPSDQLLLERFGGDAPEQAYVGPIESSSSVIALLYADQSTSDAGIPDTHGLEVVLHHAGLALDRAALERALWEVDADATR